MYEDKVNEKVIARIEHRYLTDCVTVKALAPYYYFFMVCYTLLSVVWIKLTNYKYE